MLDLAAWAFLVLALALAVVHRETLASLWFETEDPRAIARFRILFAAVLAGYLLSLAPLAGYLFSNAGIHTGAEAKARWGRMAPWSPLYYWDSPIFVRVYLGSLFACVCALGLGLCTRVASWASLFLLLGLTARNSYHHGGEQAFTCFLFCLCFARSGEVYSIDAWIRQRWRPRVVETIPSWPRYLMWLQMVPFWFANGLSKHGPMWRRGDTFYYLANNPSYQRIDMYRVSELLTPAGMRLMTWAAHLCELLFPLVIIGCFLERAKPVALVSPRRRWVSRILIVCIGASIFAMTWARWPSHPGLSDWLALSYGAAFIMAPMLMRIAVRAPVWIREVPTYRTVWIIILTLFSAQLFFVLRIGWFTGVALCTVILLVRAGAGFQPGGEPKICRSTSYGRKVAVIVLSVTHILSVAVVLLPHRRSSPTWREQVELPARVWVRNVNGAQVWRMAASGAPTKATTLELVIVSADGAEQSVGDGILEKPAAAFTKRRKLASRIAGRAHLRQAHARWVCEGRGLSAPAQIVFYQYVKAIPTPQRLAAFGAEDARRWMLDTEHRRTLDTISCPLER